jgi:hypothetical protein
VSLQPADPAAEAFEQLRREVALLRRAVEGLAGEGREPPVDYAPTLAGLRKAVKEVGAGVEALGERPALVLTIEQLVTSQHRMVSGLVAQPIAELERDRTAFAQAVEVIRAAQRAELRRDQLWRRALALAAASAVAGALAWGLALGPVARALPASWRVPERLAAATLDLPMAEAGRRLLAARDQAGREDDAPPAE